jgi:hypothetical protein
MWNGIIFRDQNFKHFPGRVCVVVAVCSRSPPRDVGHVLHVHINTPSHMWWYKQALIMLAYSGVYITAWNNNIQAPRGTRLPQNFLHSFNSRVNCLRNTNKAVGNNTTHIKQTCIDVTLWKYTLPSIIFPIFPQDEVKNCNWYIRYTSKIQRNFIQNCSFTGQFYGYYMK